MELSEESAVNQEKKGGRARGWQKKKNSAADYFPFFLGFLSPALLFFFHVHCEASWWNVCVCVGMKGGGGCVDVASRSGS